MDIVNYIDYKTLCSNLVYPLGMGYKYIARLDNDWVVSKLRTMGCTDIGNKYLVLLKANDGSDMLITNHDGKYWLTCKS
jgi:hypothetical protein